MKFFRIFRPDSDSGGASLAYNGEVRLDLKGDCWTSSDIAHNSRISLDLGKVPITTDLHKKIYLVTVEEIAGPNADEHIGDYSRRIMQECEEREVQAAGLSPAIARRLKSVS